MNRRGAVAGTSALVMVVLLGFAGLAVDTGRIWLVEGRLKTAIDASALVAARMLTDASRNATATSLFWAQFSQGGGSHAYLGASITNPTITPSFGGDSSMIQISATATIPTTLFGIISQQSTSFTDNAVAQRAGSGLEVAIVLDQTSSMLQTEGSQTKLAAAQAAVGTLLGILYGSQDTQKNLWVSVVPFARTVNIGTGNSALLTTSGLGSGWSLANWTGCVENLRNNSDTLDASPAVWPLTPYFYPSTYKQVGTAPGTCSNSNAYAAVSGTRYCWGDNDWTSPGVGPSGYTSNPEYTTRTGYGLTAVQAWGPSIFCALTPIQPLTASKSTVQAVVNAIQAPVKSAGTTTPAGLLGAWWTLSPYWQGYWQDPNSGIPNTPALPLPYNTPHMQKVVVMLTDGDDNWQPAYSSQVRSAASGSELLFDAYGRVATYNAAFPTAKINPIDQTHADPALGTRFTAICNAMKATGIIVYMIGFEVASGDVARLQACASSSSDYISSPSASNLQAAFTTVANQLASLRLVQ